MYGLWGNKEKLGEKCLECSEAYVLFSYFQLGKKPKNIYFKFISVGNYFFASTFPWFQGKDDQKIIGKKSK